MRGGRHEYDDVMMACWHGTRFRTGILLFVAAFALAAALAWLPAPAAAFKLVSCPPGGAPNVACPAPNAAAGGASPKPATTWLDRHLGAPWLSLLIIGTVALSEATRAGMEHQVRRQGALLPHPVRPHELLPWPLGPRAVPLLAGCLVLALGSFALGAAAFSQPTSREVAVSTPYQEHGSFSYSAPASGGIYDGDAARTGQPIFPNLSKTVDLSFDYDFASAAASDLSGTVWLAAVVGDGSGWSKSIELHPEMGFSGTSASISGTLDLSALQTIIDDYQRESGLHPASYQVAIAPRVLIHGSLDGNYFEDAFAPALDFVLDQSSLHLADHAAGVDPLTPAVNGATSDSDSQTRDISFAGLGLPVGLARSLATTGLLLALGGVFAVLWVARSTPPLNEVERIRARYGRHLVAIQPGSLHDRDIVEVREMDDLGRLAERERLPILVDEGTPRYYYVRHGALLYRYRLLVDSPLPPDLEQDLFG